MEKSRLIYRKLLSLKSFIIILQVIMNSFHFSAIQIDLADQLFIQIKKLSSVSSSIEE